MRYCAVVAVAEKAALDDRTELGTRGRLVIKDRAVARVVMAAAASVPGVTRSKGGLTLLVGRELPRADVSVGEDSVAVNLYIGVLWPSRVAEVASAVHDCVAEALVTITGLPLHRMNVVITGTTTVDEPASAVIQDSSHITPGHLPLSAGHLPDPITPATSPVAPGTSHVARACGPPTASPAVLPVALVLGVAALGAAFVAGREFLIANNTISGAPWVRNTVDAIAGLHWESWMSGAAVAAAVVGLALIALALKPRARTHTGVASPGVSSPTVWMRPTDLARISSDNAHSVPGVVSARTTVTKRAVTVKVHRTSTSNPAALKEAVRDSLGATSALTGGSRRLKIEIAEDPS